MVNYFYDCYTILNKVYSEKTFIKQAINSTVIEEKNRALTIKTCYGVIDKDITLSYYLSALADKSPKLAIRTIIKIAMYAYKFLGKKTYAVIDTAVELTKKLGKKGASGFVNAILRKFVSTEIPLPNEEINYLSVKYSYPPFAVKRLINSYGKEKAESMMAVSLTDNCVCFYGLDGEDYLKNHGVEYKTTPFENVFLTKGLALNQDFYDGVFTFQDLGSVAICEEVLPCENLLDCCSAPGGKTVRLSFKCKNITAFDIHEHRVKLIEEYCARMHRTNVKACAKDAKVLDESLVEKFDAVLCDVPCSGLGVVYSNPDIKLNREESAVEEIINEQQNIISTVKNYVKRGGYLYYSTCSVLTEENIGQVKTFLKNNPDFELQNINSKVLHTDFEGTNAFINPEGGAFGFYVAVLKRIK